MASNNILAVGTSPDVAFYAWRLHESLNLSVSILNSEFPSEYPMKWLSPVLGSASFQPKNIFNHVSQIPDGMIYDVILLHCLSLQDFQSTSQSLVPFLSPKATIVIESSGYVNLEPFITLSLPDLKNLSVISIMNEFDIKKTSFNSFYHKIRGSDSRLYLGHPTNPKNLSLKGFIKAVRSMQESMRDHTSLLIANLTKEFQTYQWKLALPRIIFNPLMVVFETPYPEQLSKQILAKPLISGLISELFKIIKKMECKLVKGTESEANMWKSWIEMYPEVALKGEDFLDLPTLFYNFDRKQDMCIDLLLLQPILLADDNGIRTPYLENLYLIMCQYIKINVGKDSLFFTRKSPNRTAFSDEEYQKLTQDYDQKSESISGLTKELEGLQLRLNDMGATYTNLESKSREIDLRIQSQEAKLSQLMGILANKENDLRRMDAELHNKRSQINNNVDTIIPDPTLQTEFNGYRKSSELPDRKDLGPEKLDDMDVLTDSVQRHVQPQTQHPQPVRSLLIDADTQPGSGFVPQLQNTGPQQPQYNQHTGPQQQQHTGPQQQQQQHTGPHLQQQQQHTGPQQQYNGSQLQYPGPQQQYVPQHGYPTSKSMSFTQNGPGPHSGNQGGYNANYQGRPPQQYNGGQNGYNNGHQMNGYNGGAPNGPNGYNNGHQQQPWDQQPPHGLPSSGLLPNAPPVFNQQRFGSQGSVPQSGYPKQRQALFSSSTYFDQVLTNNGLQPSFGNQSTATMSKKNLRRSMMPGNTQTGNLLGLDMGGRGGMPQPMGPTGERPNFSGLTSSQNLNQGRSARPVSAMPNMGSHNMNGHGNSGGQSTLPSLAGLSNFGGPMQLRKSQIFPQGYQKDLQIPPQQQQTLQIPPSGGQQSNGLTVTSGETPKTLKDDIGEILMNVPEGKPLGGIRPTEDGDKKKKKRGLFGRKK